MKASEIDRRFDNGEDVLDEFDLSTAYRPNLTIKRVNVDFPTWVVEALDAQAQHIGVTRQALIKLWIAERVVTENTRVPEPIKG